MHLIQCSCLACLLTATGVQVWLALPSNCPYGPDGSKRKLSAEDKVASSVILYMSDDEGTSFTEVRNFERALVGCSWAPASLRLHQG